MFEKCLKLGNKNIKIICNHNSYFQNENIIIFGFPFNIEKRPILKEELNQAKGYFLQININNNAIEITNDIAGLYRFYYLETNNTLYYDLYWGDIVNTFESNNFWVRVVSDNGGYNQNFATAPFSNGPLKERVAIPANTIQHYTVSFTLHGTGEEQNYDQGKLFKGKINVVLLES